jgi:Asp-tRNA(Asn)/Glu-tRNA(Gln) amidotransferase A subunit family amidase
LPIGFRLVDAIGQDEMLLDVAAAYERLRPIAGRRPPLR